ncbi:N-terminal phage integrase SAM-like domain-containing protein [Vallitalea guaymasensis]|uniref:Integrase SAM-like N-terminal domain-containing protein n=1 Tax=Vallitalea guaymasensis TaxID=1185412 RepID=A0A8J8SCF1_9FIRM|nr:hypothetical protein HYG85_12090 [Vallitalea guaymasensis]
MREYLNEHEKNKHLLSGHITMRQYCEIWYDNYVVLNVKLNTQKRYRLMMKNHIIPYFGDMNIKEIKPIILQNYYTHLTKPKVIGGAGFLVQQHLNIIGYYIKCSNMRLVGK